MSSRRDCKATSFYEVPFIISSILRQKCWRNLVLVLEINPDASVG